MAMKIPQVTRRNGPFKCADVIGLAKDRTYDFFSSCAFFLDGYGVIERDWSLLEIEMVGTWFTTYLQYHPRRISVILRR
jgi:hypothetical protein